MLVKLLVPRSGVDFSQNAGDVVDVSDQEAVRMFEAGQAEPMREQKKETAAAKTKPEKATK